MGPTFFWNMPKKTDNKKTWLDFAIQVLVESDSPLPYDEIWKRAQPLIKKAVAEGSFSYSGKTPEATLAASLYTAAKNRSSAIVAFGSRPVLFGIRGKHYASIVPPPSATEEEKEDVERERVLYNKLVCWLYRNHRIYGKIIHHTASSRKEKGRRKWVYPDVVAFSSPLLEWMAVESTDRHKVSILRELSQTMGQLPVKLISFEVKIRLDFGNLRESFFQTVSNSSWANEAYLVASYISEDIDFRDELSSLCERFGVGVIHLTPDNLEDSTILVPARYNEILDWKFIYILSSENPHFSSFIESFLKDISSLSLSNDRYDYKKCDDYLNDGFVA